MRKIQPAKQVSKREEPGDVSDQSRLARFGTVLAPSRSAGVIFILVIVGIYVFVRLFAPSDIHQAQLRFVESGSTEDPDVETGKQPSYREPLSGTAYDTALRLREAGALGLAVSLSVFAKNASTGTAPATPQEVIREMTVRQLIPPGIEVEDGSLRSGLSELRFSYRPEPLSFEILALPKGRADGSSLLLKFPLSSSESNSIMYFESATSAQIPAPFASNEQIAAAGWRIRHWRGDALPLNESIVRELREQDDWLKSRNQGR